MLAERGAGLANPNPLVGAVVVKDGRVIGEGFHALFGGPHAEAAALNSCSESPAGATVYVNLEPCAHFGKTPPCCEALIATGVKRVVSAMEDPNPLVAGQGHGRLREAGIEVTTGVLEAEARRLNEIFIKFITTGRPFVLLKSAVTLDGKTASVTGSSKWISSAPSRAYVHRLRRRYAAIMVGIGTVLADDPLLSTRGCQGDGPIDHACPEGDGVVNGSVPLTKKNCHGVRLTDSAAVSKPDPVTENPAKIVVDGRLRIPLDAKLLRSEGKTLIVAAQGADAEKAQKLREIGVEVPEFPAIDGKIRLTDVIAELGRRGIDSVLLEGGGELNAHALSEGIVDKLVTFIAPKLIGGAGAPTFFGGAGIAEMESALPLRHTRVWRCGGDVVIESALVQ